jgi:hypothetical protein
LITLNALDAEVQQMIGAISSYSLIECQPTNNTFTIPSTIHLWLRESQDDTQLEDRLWDAFRLISKSVSKEPQVSEDFTFERRIPIHLHACWKNIHDHFRPQDLKHYPNTLPMYHAACLLSRQGMWTDAKDIFWRIMAISKRVLGLEHPATLNNMFNLAAVYVNTGRWTDAEELIVNVLNARKGKLGHEHYETIRCKVCHADICSNQGRLIEAENLELEVLKWRKRFLPHDHPDTLASFSNLAWTYTAQGLWKEAEGFDMQALEGRKRVLGNEHPDTQASNESCLHI